MRTKLLKRMRKDAKNAIRLYHLSNSNSPEKYGSYCIVRRDTIEHICGTAFSYTEENGKRELERARRAWILDKIESMRYGEKASKFNNEAYNKELARL